MKDIQKVLGHSSVRTTETYYAKYSPHSAARRVLVLLQGRAQSGRDMSRPCSDAACRVSTTGRGWDAAYRRTKTGNSEARQEVKVGK